MKKVAILITLLVLSAPFSVLAVQVNCKGRNVIVIAEKEADCQAACDAVDIGGLFFESDRVTET